MTPLPLVSICIPAFNAEKTLQITLDSIFRQTYSNYEVLVSDNQSTDATPDIVHACGDRARYCLFTAGKPEWARAIPGYSGAFDNWNFALSQGKGEFLCLYHSDDVYEPSIVSKQAAFLQAHPEVGAVFTMMRAIGEDGRPIKLGVRRLIPEFQGRQIFSFPEIFNAIMRHANFIPAPSVMFRRSALEAVGGFEERYFLTSADLDMWLRVARQYPIGILDEPLLNYRYSSQQGSAQITKNHTQLEDFFQVMDAYLREPQQFQLAEPEALAIYRVRRASDQILCAIHLAAENKLPEARLVLREALIGPHFATALSRPHFLARLLLGVGLLASTYLGIGHWAGQQLRLAHQRELARRREPIVP